MTTKTCRNGHEKTPENTYLYRGYGACRICKRRNNRNWERRNPEAVKENLKKWHENNPGRAKEASRAGYEKNRDKRIKQAKKWKADNPERARDIQLKKYGITSKEHESMKQDQKNLCAICGSPPGKRALHIDHNHETGQIRGLLCSKCNVALGLLKDDPNIVQAAESYLRQD